MSQELKAVTVNLKSLDQDIQDPIVAGGADANGRTFFMDQFVPDCFGIIRFSLVFGGKPDEGNRFA